MLLIKAAIKVPMKAVIKTPMEEALQKFISDSLRTSDFSIEPLEGEVSAREYYKISTHQKDFILVKDIPHSKNWDLFFKAHRCLASSTFIPKVFYKEDSCGWALLEFLGKAHLKDAPLSYYPKALEQITNWQTIELSASFLKEHSFLQEEKFTPLIFKQELLMGYEKLKSFFESLSISMDFIKKEKEIQKEIESLSQLCSQIPFTICHRDYHCKNLMIWEEKLFVIDFQNTRLGPCVYDVVSLLEDPYCKIPQQQKEELLSYYQIFFEGVFPQSSWEKSYSHCALQRLLKACGTYCLVWLEKEDSKYLPFLPTALENSLSFCEGFPHLQKMIQESLEHKKRILKIIV